MKVSNSSTPMQSPLLSIVVLTCNQRYFTVRLLESLSAYMATRPDTELILIDNGSTDGTIDTIRHMGNPWADQMTIIRNDRNLGVAAGRNIGLKKAKGTFIMLLDNDTMVTADAIESLVGHMRNSPATGLAAPALISMNGTLQDSAKPYPGMLLKARHLLGFKQSASEKAAMNALHPPYVIGACQIFRKKLLDSVGLLDENIFYGPEDADFCMRIMKQGFSIDYLKHISITHDWQRATSRKPVSSLAFKHFLGLIYFYKKHRRIL